MQIKLIVAVGRNREMGKVDLESGKFELPNWTLPGDMQRMKAVTTGGYLFMGERTWESLPEKIRPLKDRVSIILTHNKNYPDKFNEKEREEFSKGNIIIINSEEEFQKFISDENKGGVLWIFGGAMVYKSFEKYASELYITEVEGEFPECNVIFPDLDLQNENKWKLVSKERGNQNLEEKTGQTKKPASHEFYYCVYRRVE